jgi:hypothetical protein
MSMFVAVPTLPVDPLAHYLSRSAADQDDICRRKRFNSTVLLGTGVSPAGSEAPELAFGSCIHLGPQTIWATGGDLEAADERIVASPYYAGLMDAHKFLVRCLSYAYGLTTYPRLKQHWKLIACEREVQYTVGTSSSGRAIILLAQPDLLLEHKATGLVRYFEFKSTKLLTDRYLRSWQKAVQLVAGALAVKETLGITIDQFEVSFFYKGEAAEDYWRSPFTSAYTAYVDGEVKYATPRPQKYKGWERFNLHESTFRNNPRAWVEKLMEIDPNLLPGQLPSVEVSLDRQQADAWTRQLAIREREIADFVEWYARGEALDLLQRELDETFKQTFSACLPAMGADCPFYGLCHNPGAAQHPLRHGYQHRTPHHETEARALAARIRTAENRSESVETTRV